MKRIYLQVIILLIVLLSVPLGSIPAHAQSTVRSFFQNTRVNTPADGTIEVNVFLSTSSIKVSATEISISYAPNILDYQDAPDSSTVSPTCNNLQLPSRLRVLVDTTIGLVRITRINSASDDALPSGIFCFGAITFKPKPGIALPATTQLSLDTNVSHWQIVGPQGNLTPQFDNASSTVTVNITAPDTTPPSVSWVSPVVAQGQVYTTTSGSVATEVSVSDSSGISQVHFWRWDAVNLQVIDLGTLFTAPYRVTIDVNSLNVGDNEIDADVRDSAGNITNTYFWINRSIPANLVKNGNFEADANNDGKPDAWSTNSRFTRSSGVVHSGSYAGKFRATDNSGVTISQAITGLSAGKAYSVTGWVNIPQTSDTFTFKLQVRWKNANGSTISTKVIKTYSAGTAGWTQATASLVAPTGTTNTQVQLVVSSLNATIYIDDVVFQ